MTTSVVKKLQKEFGGDWVYIHTKGYWINNKGRYAMTFGNTLRISIEGKYHEYANTTRNHDDRSRTRL